MVYLLPAGVGGGEGHDLEPAARDLVGLRGGVRVEEGRRPGRRGALLLQPATVESPPPSPPPLRSSHRRRRYRERRARRERRFVALGILSTGLVERF
jgi:hypothetical protein